MRISLVIHRILVFSVLLSSMVFYSCKDDLFNAEKVKAAYQDKFPVKDIDPNMDWKMTQPVKVDISVNEYKFTDYKIRIYDANPLSENSQAKLLAEGVANDTQTFNTVIDCPSTLTGVFVCRIDPNNRNVVKYASITNEQIHLTFGTLPVTKNTRAHADIKIETYTPKMGEAEVRNLLSQAEELHPSTVFTKQSVYKISAGEEFSTQLKAQDGGLWGERATLIICGKWIPKGNNMNIPNGINIYVLEGGSIEVPKNKEMTFNVDGYLGVFKGGEVIGEESDSKIILAQNSGINQYFYNAGTIRNINLSTSESGSVTIYNCGNMYINQLKCIRFVNQGHAELTRFLSINGDDRTTIENGCYLKVDTFEGHLTCGSTSYTKIENFNIGRGDWPAHTQLGVNALLEINSASLSERRFHGPSNEYALVRIGKIADLRQNFTTDGNIYYEFAQTVDSPTEDSYRQKFFDALKNNNGAFSKWGESPIFIPASDCTGEGNTPNNEGTTTPETPMSYTYVFEDNYPMVGDYDFNDVVLDVNMVYDYNPKNKNAIQAIHLNVKLAAAGASKAVGVGLRIVSTDSNPIKKADISNITTASDHEHFLSSFDDSNSLFNYNQNTYIENGSGDEIVIPIAGEVHNVFGVELGTLVNTGGNGVEAPIYNCEFIFELKDKNQNVPLFSKDNLDFFICYQYKGMTKRMEVHLYEFWNYGATPRGTVQKANLDVAGNNTWAICIPKEYRYPKERINISRTDEPEASAYPQFIGWARNRETNQDWYEHPIKENVYR